jgi:hypothetical protein
MPNCFQRSELRDISGSQNFHADDTESACVETRTGTESPEAVETVRVVGDLDQLGRSGGSTARSGELEIRGGCVRAEEVRQHAAHGPALGIAVLRGLDNLGVHAQ